MSSPRAPHHDAAQIRSRLDALLRRADLPPAAPRDALALDPAGAVVGSLERGVAERLVGAGLLRPHGQAWRVEAPADESLARIARWLAQAGLAGRWRDELLDVHADGLGRLAVVERAVVRTLGIRTSAVHLVGVAPDGAMWVQQRALDKATDPGLWDTLMGGQVGAGESSADTLERETWEEAGLRSAQLLRLAPAGHFEMRRPVHEGYLIERLEVFEAVVPDGCEPNNQDGEVHAFERLAPAQLRARLEAGLFTLEAALILWAWLERQAAAPR